MDELRERLQAGPFELVAAKLEEVLQRLDRVEAKLDELLARVERLERELSAGSGARDGRPQEPRGDRSGRGG
ncbi:MAG: hypothetical protein ABGY09_01250 [Euryarchaeota archaeon]